ncbi:hypothetical protein A4A49_21395 [Nicotiana attenuata]|uniref:DUF1985 domain-containing protein n=1 Tax=Nicotiana attenuata TaxID=49451 RepID=A0A1J6HXI2_NICAT|nr:hypothetical protein A4A49_21395 [Nicotiana attenuata]
MVFLVNGVKLRFGLAEFAFVTGFKCTRDVQLCSEVRQNKNGSIAKYFKDYPTVSNEHLVDCFLTKTFDSDEDAIKIAVLFVVYSFLFSIKNTKHIDKKYLDLVDKGDYNSYPWGIDIYEETVRTISGILDKQRQYYWLSGFPYAVQVWFYECFGYLDSYVACRRENISPPILRWSVTRQLKFEELNDKLYGLPSEKLNLRNMSLENKIEDNVDQIHVTSDDDFVDRPPETLKRQCKMMINENAKRKGTPSNVLEKKGKDVNNLKKQRKDVNETSKMKSIGANDLEKQMMDNVSNSINVTAANKKSGKVVENIHNQNQGIGEACVDPSTKHSEWYTQFKILQDGQDELRKEVSSLKKEYKEELVVLKNYLDGKFVELFNVINSMKKSTLEHHHNGDVKKDVEGDSERKQDAVNEIKQENENYSLTMAEVVSLERTRSQRARARNTSRSASNTSGSASIRITRSQSSKECEISDSKSIKEPVVDVSQNNIKPAKKRNDSESSTHTRRNSKSFLKLNASDRPILGNNFNSEIVSNLKTKLSTTQLELFKSTCFGYLLNLPSIKLQTQLIYYLLTKEVEKGKANQMVFLVNGVKLRFGLAEFAFVTGFKYTRDVQLCSEVRQNKNGSIAKYFKDYPTVSKEHLVDCFLTKTFDSDEDAIKIAVLFVVYSLLFSIKNTKHIDKNYLDLVDKGDYNSYPWGIDIYDEIVRTISGILDKQRQYYWLSGFPYVVQVWFYECFGNLDSYVACRRENISPPILRWSVTRQLKFEELNDKLYGLPSEKHQHNGDVEKDVEGDSERKQDAVNEIEQENENYSLTMAEVVSLERTRSQRARARNTSRSASNTSGSASIRITRSQSSKECEISDSKSIKEPVVDVSQNNIKPTKKRNDSESSTHTRRNSKSFLKLNASDRPILGNNFNSEIVSNLKTKLSTELFKSTCFGYLLNLPSIKLQTQLIYYLLTKEVEKGTANQMVFLVNGNTKHIDKKYLDLVDKGDYNSYPWGIDIYDETVRTISGILDKQQQYYWLSGFPYAVQVWFYECFGNLDSYVACRRENISPPILRWSVTRQLKFEELNDKLYGLPSEKIHVTSDDDFVDRPPETLKKLCKMMINENAKRKGTPSNVLEKKGKDVNNLKKQRKDVNETSKMKSIGANDLEKQMMDKVSNSINVTAANKKSGKVVENIHNQNQGIGEAFDPSTKHSEWYTQFKILQDGQDELRKEVSSLKKEYKEELVVLKNYLDGKFVELFNVINSMKKSTLEHHHNGDVKKDVEGDSERKQDAVNEIKQGIV